MKNFIKKLFITVLAFFISSILVFALFFILIVSLTSNQRNKYIKINDNSVLALSFKSKVIEYDTENQISAFHFNKEENLKLQDILNAIHQAKNDDRIKGISIEIDDIDAGITQLNDIRKSLEDFKKSKKFVYAYGNNVSQGSYYLSSVADQYFLNPVGKIELKGLSAEVLFFKDFVEKYGINMNIIRHGKYKAAVEPFLRNDMSAENRKQISTMLNDLWREISTQIMESRKLNQQMFNTIVDNLYGILPDLSLKHQLVDKLLQKSEYENFLKRKLNIDKDEQLNKISISQYIDYHKENKSFNNNKIAVLYASGTLYDGNKTMDIHSEKYIKYIKDLADDEQIKAVVLRVNSPGGSANASDAILFELQQLQQKKPLVVSFGDHAASGGYYISMAADKIFAQNNTITGSIGVFGMIPDAKKLANNQGIYSEIVSTNANSKMMSPISGISSGTVAIMQKSVEQTYARFIHFVAQNRNMTLERVDAIGGGRVWSGKRAKDLGLVDEIGNLNDAISYASKKAKLTDYEVENYPTKIDKFEQIFGSIDEENISTKYLKKQVGENNYQLFKLFVSPQSQSNIQMMSPYQVSIK
ncbi:MAG: signal peptide peptidase SppA [Flavobacteriaceae bacterium]|nr:signal peptide peptidase SppA [Flavobacteriaceae bacterium]